MSYNVTFNASALLKGLNAQIDAAMVVALEQVSVQLRANWQEGIYRAPGIYQALRDRYANSINYTVNKQELSARIWSDDPMASPAGSSRRGQVNSSSKQFQIQRLRC